MGKQAKQSPSTPPDKGAFDQHLKDTLKSLRKQLEAARHLVDLHPSPPKNYGKTVKVEIDRTSAAINALEKAMLGTGQAQGKPEELPEEPETPTLRRRQTSVFDIPSPLKRSNSKEFDETARPIIIDGVVDPDSAIKYAWDSIVVILVIIDVMIIPVQLAYVGDHPTGFLAVWPWMLLIFFTVDIILTFMTGLVPKKRAGNKGLITDKAVIAQTYVYSFAFVTDVLTTFPFWLLADFMTGLGPLSTIAPHLRALRLVRMLRLAKLAAIQDRVEEKMASLLFLQFLAFVRVVFTLLVICHWNACLWWIMGQDENPVIHMFPASYQTYYDSLPHWVTVERSGPDGSWTWEGQSHYESYMFCFYWTLGVMRTMPAEVLPANPFERVYVLVFMFVAFSAFAITVGQAVAVFTKFTERNRTFKEDLMSMHMYMHSIAAPDQLKACARDYVKLLFTRRRIQAKELGMISLLPDTLKEEMKFYQLKPHLARIPRLEQLARKDMKRVCGISEIRQLEDGSVVSQKGCLADGAWVLITGHLSIYDGPEQDSDIVDLKCLDTVANVLSESTIATNEPSELVFIPKSAFIQLELPAGGLREETSEEPSRGAESHGSSSPLVTKSK